MIKKTLNFIEFMNQAAGLMGLFTAFKLLFVFLKKKLFLSLDFF
jgi:hypothetical protein